jgi:hypothetical protein
MATLIEEKGKGNFGKYVELGDILKMVKPVLAANGLSVMQEPMATEDGVGVATTILHSSGARIEFVPLVIALADRKPHTVGSAVTYAKRYALAAIFGLEGGVDDDGQEAQDSFKVKPKETPPVDDDLWETPAAHAKKPDTLSPEILSRITTLGVEVYGKDFATQAGKLAEWASQGARKTLGELKVAEGEKLIRSLEKKLNPVIPHENGVTVQ